MDETIKVIKSLLTTSSDGLLVNEINAEYKDMTGQSIPFREYGFDTLADFLRSTNQFSGTKLVNGSIKVTVKIPGKSAHIIAMRQKQNVSAADRKRRKKGMTKTGGMTAFQSIPSQVMGRSSGGGGIISKQRTRVQPQRRNPPVKSIGPTKMVTTTTRKIDTNKPPVNRINHTETLQKGILYDRLTKFKPTVPTIMSMPMKIVPITPPPTSPEHDQPPETQPYEDRSCRSNLMARLTAQKIEPSTETMQHHAVAIGRSALRKMCQNLSTKNDSPSMEIRLTCNGNGIEQKPSDVNSRLQPEPAAFGKTVTRRDLYARLAQKVTPLANGANHIDNVQTNDRFSSDALLQQTNKKTDIYLRLQPKQIDTESPDFQQIFQGLNNMHLMQVDIAEQESQANFLEGAQKFNLSVRLQPRHCEMDCEQFNWVRSVKASGSQLKVTVNLN